MHVQNYLLLAVVVVEVAATAVVVVPEVSLKRKSPLRNKFRELPLAPVGLVPPTLLRTHQSIPHQLELSAEVIPLPWD
jgi:hypothetical protein